MEGEGVGTVSAWVRGGEYAWCVVHDRRVVLLRAHLGAGCHLVREGRGPSPFFKFIFLIFCTCVVHDRRVVLLRAH